METNLTSLSELEKNRKFKLAFWARKSSVLLARLNFSLGYALLIIHKCYINDKEEKFPRFIT